MYKAVFEGLEYVYPVARYGSGNKFILIFIFIYFRRQFFRGWLKYVGPRAYNLNKYGPDYYVGTFHRNYIVMRKYYFKTYILPSGCNRKLTASE